MPDFLLWLWWSWDTFVSALQSRSLEPSLFVIQALLKFLGGSTLFSNCCHFVSAFWDHGTGLGHGTCLVAKKHPLVLHRLVLSRLCCHFNFVTDDLSSGFCMLGGHKEKKKHMRLNQAGEMMQPRGLAKSSMHEVVGMPLGTVWH